MLNRAFTVVYDIHRGAEQNGFPLWLAQILPFAESKLGNYLGLAIHLCGIH